MNQRECRRYLSWKIRIYFSFAEIQDICNVNCCTNEPAQEELQEYKWGKVIPQTRKAVQCERITECESLCILYHATERRKSRYLKEIYWLWLFCICLIWKRCWRNLCSMTKGNDVSLRDAGKFSKLGEWKVASWATIKSLLKRIEIRRVFSLPTLTCHRVSASDMRMVGLQTRIPNEWDREESCEKSMSSEKEVITTALERMEGLCETLLRPFSLVIGHYYVNY